MAVPSKIGSIAFDKSHTIMTIEAKFFSKKELIDFISNMQSYVEGFKGKNDK